MSRIRVATVLLSAAVLLTFFSPASAQWVVDGIPVVTTGNPSSHRAVTDGAGGSIVVWWSADRIYAQRVDADGYIGWASAGDTVSTSNREQAMPVAIPDGYGGAIITWQASWYDEVNDRFYEEIWAQRIDSAGSRLWTDEGVLVRSDTTSAMNPDVTMDAAGSCVVVWHDYRTEVSFDIYAQKIDITGVILWTSNGVGVCIASGDQTYPQVVSDGAGGTIITWQDARSGDYDIYAQRLDTGGISLWTGGTAVCVDASNFQTYPRMIADGSGGAIIAWEDNRNFFTFGYCQRIDATGASQWTANGILVPSGLYPMSSYSHQRLISDGSGGVIIVWSDGRSFSDIGIYAQRFDGNGNRLWTGDVTVCDEPGNQSDPEIAAGAGGGAVIAWTDDRVGSAMVFAQILDAGGNLLLAGSGGLVCGKDDYSNTPVLAADGSGGATVVWRDSRGSTHSLYAQHVDPEAGWRTSDPEILSVDDISPDQGGWVRIHLAAAIYDRDGGDYQATSYNVWRLISVGAATAAGAPDGVTFESGFPAGGIPTCAVVSPAQALLLGLPPGTWESLGMHPAMQEDEYWFTAPTSDDSTSAGIPWETYAVSVHTASPSFYIFSEPDSGYSVDDLAPGAPLSLAGEQSFEPAGLQLTWDPVAAADMWHYVVYRGTSGDFTPDEGNRIGVPADPELFDGGWSWDGGFWYKVAAVDRHGNESVFAVLAPGSVTGDDPMPLPEATFLAQNFPNPFNPFTTIAFGIKASSHVSLSVFDAAGRQVTTLIDETMPAGSYSVEWNGLSGGGSKAASGVYFYRLTAGTFIETRKMVLLR